MHTLYSCTGSEDTSTNSGHTFTHSDSQPVGLIRVMALTWPIMGALFLSGLILCTIFPFFTFVPSSGKLGDTLPQARVYPFDTNKVLSREQRTKIRNDVRLLKRIYHTHMRLKANSQYCCFYKSIAWFKLSEFQLVFRNEFEVHVKPSYRIQAKVISRNEGTLGQFLAPLRKIQCTYAQLYERD